LNQNSVSQLSAAKHNFLYLFLVVAELSDSWKSGLNPVPSLAILSGGALDCGNFEIVVLIDCNDRMSDVTIV
jgi:hypothetical protein